MGLQPIFNLGGKPPKPPKPKPPKPKPYKPPTAKVRVRVGTDPFFGTPTYKTVNKPLGRGTTPAPVRTPKARVPKRAPVKPPQVKAKPLAAPPVRPAASSRPVRKAPIPIGVKRAPQGLARPKPKPKRTIAPADTGPVADTPDLGTGGFDDYLSASLAPALQAIEYQRQQQAMQDQRRISSINALTQQFLGYIKGVPAQVGADYDQALATQQSLGAQARDALTAANPNAQTQADLQAIGAPAAQEQAVTDQNQATFAGGGAVLYGTGAQIPGGQLATDKAAQLAFIRSLPAIASAQGQKTLQAYLQTSQQASSDLDQQLAQLYAQVPKMRLEYDSQQQSNFAKQQQLDLEYRALGLKRQNQQFSQGLAVQKLGVSKAQLGLSKASLSLRALQSDRSWQATLRRLGIADAQLKISAAKAQAQLNGGGYTTSQKLGLKKRAGKIASDAFNGVAIPANQNNGVAGAMRHLSYQDAIREMLSQGIPLTVAQQALNTYWSRPGYTAPFEYTTNQYGTRVRLPGAGRPLLSYQQRQAQAKKRKK